MKFKEGDLVSYNGSQNKFSIVLQVNYYGSEDSFDGTIIAEQNYGLELGYTSYWVDREYELIEGIADVHNQTEDIINKLSKLEEKYARI